MGVFGLGEIIANLQHEGTRSIMLGKVSGMLPGEDDLRRIVGPVLRGTGLGSIVGILPGGGAMLVSFSSYSLEKKLAADPSRFGNGAIEGVAAPEAANNAGAQTSFVPMLTLGIPSNPVMALMIGAMIIYGIQPGPAVMTEQPALFLGAHRLDVGPQRDAAGAQPAADRPVGDDDQRALSLPVSGDPGVLRDRRLQLQQRRVRPAADGGVRRAGLLLPQARL
jgi:hypothetical protein